MNYNYKIVDKNTGEVIASGKSKTTLEVVKQFKLAYESQQHLQAIFSQL